MHGLLDNSENLKVKTFQKIMDQLNGLMAHLPSEGDRQILTRMVSECFHKHYEAIKSMECDDPSLMAPLIMDLIVDQNSMIHQLKDV